MILDSLAIGDHDRWLKQGLTVGSRWAFTDFGTEDRSMICSQLGLVIDVPGLQIYEIVSKPPFLIKTTYPDILEVPFDEQAPPSITEFIESIGQINLSEE